MSSLPNHTVTSTLETSATTRWASLDIFRALTMLFMLFVNDLWSLHDIPAWLEHVPADADGMGFADIVFPTFLFIVGLSIPLAINRRLQKGDSIPRVILYIAKRSLALLVMGFYHVNSENINSDLIPISRGMWSILATLAFFLIWNVYPQGKVLKRIPAFLFQGIGIVMLAGLAWIYKGGNTESPVGMQTHWWGILGLIGWAYLLCSVLYLFLRKHPALLWLAWLVLLLLNMQEFYPLGASPFRILISASNYTLVWAGVITTCVTLKQSTENQAQFPWRMSLELAMALLLAGLWLRPLWGISKIRATPSWTLICTAICLVVLTVLYFIADTHHKTKWARFLAPAGRSTLTCYLLPYVVYPLISATGLTLPSVLTGGLIGLCKSMIFAITIIYLTGTLEKRKIQLRI
jgi:heparan-alpha-glucosaminide N-acetyltransferase